MGVGAGPGDRSSLPKGRHDVSREQIIDATLKLFVRQGYDATTIDQVAATAGVSPADVTRHFPSTEAVLVAVAGDMARATAAGLNTVAKGTDPVHALLQAGTSALGAIVEGRSEVPLDRLLAMSRIVTATSNLHRKISVARKRVLTQPLADWMGVDPQNRRVRHALTMWSAVVASAYVSALGLPDPYESGHDAGIHQRMISGIRQSFGEVMGDDPEKSD